MSKSIHAGRVEPSIKHYLVSEAHGHKTLNENDIVVMSVDWQTGDNRIIRIADMTIHPLKDEMGQYVHLTECTA